MRKDWSLRAFSSMVFALALIGCVESIQHDEAAARRKAEEFARVAFVRHDVENGYALLAEATKRYVSPAQFKEVLVKMHPNNFPRTVVASEYEPMPGEKAIYIFLNGENGSEHFYYRLTMQGTATADYRVLRFDRSTQPYSSSNEKRQFGGQKTG
jgi:hypothetical protein